MTHTPVARHRTAIHRSDLSRPIRVALEDGLIDKDSIVFDYGCGHGDDVSRLRARGIQCAGWDPVHHPQGERVPSDLVNLGYVINVIENAQERASVLRQAWALARRLLIVSARLDFEPGEASLTPYEDGWLTRTGTFQKYYEQHELRDWIEASLDVSSVAAAPGIFYVFRDEDLKQSFVASRFRRRLAAPRQRASDLVFEQHKDLFEPLMQFIASRGRLPDETELEAAHLIRKEIGSLRRAFSIICRATGPEQWNSIREERSQDLLVYLALARFGGRPRFSALARDLELDVRAFFSTYKRACERADSLLFSAGNRQVIDEACRASSVGKLTADALYVHTSALSHLAPALRVYEGCARALVGAVEGANLAKLHQDEPRVSYLSYPEFDKDPHPALAASLLAHLQTFRLKYREYDGSNNPPILHRKELFIAPDHPLRSKFARLTQQEERRGLYEETHSIGTRHGWEQVLKAKGVRLSGHRLVKAHKGLSRSCCYA